MTITVLLGAGASRNAGVPISTEMTNALMAKVDRQSRPLLHFVYGGLLMQQAASIESGRTHGQDVQVDVEDLFNAVEALANRTALDAAPFVTSWHPLIERVDGLDEDSVTREIERNINDLVSSSFAGKRLADTLFKAFGKREPNSNGFRHLATAMVSSLSSLLTVDDNSRIDYLAPLLDLHKAQSSGLTIATLNYDLLIEQLGAAHSLKVDDCLDNWCSTGAVTRSEALTLLKLHGSIDWVEDNDGLVRRRTATDENWWIVKPALIFGGRNKLRADGPYLEMLWEWRSHLDACDHLVIIGYSMRDAHINAVIDRWSQRNELHRVTVVDPGFNDRASRTAHNLYMKSNEYLAPFEIVGNSRVQRPDNPKAPVQIIRRGAADALPSLFREIEEWPAASLERPW